MERSTIQRSQDDEPADPIGTFDDFNVEMRQNLCKRSRKFAVLDIRRRRRASSGKETSRNRSP